MIPKRIYIDLPSIDIDITAQNALNSADNTLLISYKYISSQNNIICRNLLPELAELLNGLGTYRNYHSSLLTGYSSYICHYSSSNIHIFYNILLNKYITLHQPDIFGYHHTLKCGALLNITINVCSTTTQFIQAAQDIQTAARQ
jgi:hypothetical protein